MAYELVPLDYDPSAGAPAAAQPDLTPLDYDPGAMQPAAPAAPAPVRKPPPTPAELPPPPKENMLGTDVAPLPAEQTAAVPDLIPLDYDPGQVQKGGYIQESAKGVAAGTVGGVGSALQGGAGLGEANAYEGLKDIAIRKTVQRLRDTGVVTDDDNAPMGVTENGGLNLAAMDPQKRAIVERELKTAGASVMPPDITQNKVFQAGTAVREYSAKTFRAAADFENSWTRKIAEGFGSLGPTLAASVVAGPTGGVLVGSAMSLGETIDTAFKKGASREQVLSAITKGTLIGATEEFPIEVMLNKVPLGSWGKVMGAVVKVGAKAFAEGGQEGLQQVLQNLVTKYTYKPDQDIMEGVWESAGIGAIVGGGVGVVTAPFEAHEPDKANDVKPQTGDGIDPAVATTTDNPAGGQTNPNPPATRAATEQQEPAVAAKTTTVEVVNNGEVSADIAATQGTEPAPSVAATVETAANIQPVDEEDFDEDVPASTYEDTDAVAAPTQETQESVSPAVTAPAKQRKPTRVQKAIEIAAQRANVVSGNTDEQAALGVTTAAAAPETVPDVTRRPAPDLEQRTQLLRQTADEQTLQDMHDMHEKGQAPRSPEDINMIEDLLAEKRQQGELDARLQARQAEAPAPAPQPAPVTEPASEFGDIYGDEQVAPTDEFGGVDIYAGDEQTQEPALATQEQAPAQPAAAQGVAAFKVAPTAAEVPAQEPVAPAPAPVTATGKPVVVQAKRSVKKLLEARKAREAPQAQPKPETAPAAHPGAEKAKRAAITSELAKATHEHAAWNTDPSSDEATFPDVVARAADEVAAERQPGTAPSEFVRQNVDKVVQKVKEHFATAEQPTEEEAIIQHAKAPEVKPEVKRSDKRTGREAKAKAKEGWSKTQMANVSKEELEKAERGEPHNVHLANYRRAQLERAKHKVGRGGPESDAAIMSESYAKDMEKARQKWLAGEREKEEAEEASKPKEAPEPEVTPIQETYILQTEKSKQKAAINKVKRANKRKAELEPILAEAVAAIPPLPERALNDRQAVAAYAKRVIDAISNAIAAAGHSIGKYPNSVTQTPYENLAIYGKQLTVQRINEAGEQVTDPHPGHNILDWMLAKTYADVGDNSNFDGLILDEKVAKSEQQSEDIDQAAASSEAFNQMQPEEQQVPVRARSATSRDIADEPEGEITERGKDGKKVIVKPSRSTTGSQFLKQTTGKMPWARGGLVDVLRKMHLKMLHRMVGDIDVHFVDTATMQALSKSATSVAMYQPAGAASADAKPRIYVNEQRWGGKSPAEQMHVAIHEMTHAATEFALTKDFRGTNAIASKMTETLRAQLKASGDWDRMGFKDRYGLTNEHEFIAEAFSNPDFQDLLMSHTVPQHIAKMLQGRSDRAPTWWQAFSAFVSNAIGLNAFKGQAAMTYMQASIALHPDLMMSQQEQDRRAIEDFAGHIPLHGDYYGRPEGISESHNIDFNKIATDARDTLIAGKDRLKYGTMQDHYRYLRSIFTTTEEMNRSSIDHFGGRPQNEFTDYTHTMLELKPLRQQIAHDGDVLSVALDKFGEKDGAMAEKLSDFIHGSTKNESDPRYGLTHANNNHIKKSGFRDRDRRAKHARLEAEWAALSPEAKTVANQLIDHYRKYHQEKVALTVLNQINAAIDTYGYKLPAGVTKAAVFHWVMSGEIDKPLAQQTPRDIAIHAALKGTGQALKDSKELRTIKGVYVPLTRFGKHFFTAQENLVTPPGATLDPTAPDKNVFIFKDLKQLAAFQNSTDYTLLKKVSRWIDPRTGLVTKKINTYKDPVTGQLVVPEQEVHVTVQNKIMEMDDSPFILDQKRAAYEKMGMTPTKVRMLETEMHANDPVLPGHISRLLRNIDQNGQSPTARAIARAAVLDSYFKTLSGSRAHKNALKRNNVGGFSRDLVAATYSNNHILAGHITNLMMQPRIDAAETALKDYIDNTAKNNYAAGPKTARAQQEYYLEAKKRLTSLQTKTSGDTAWSRFGNALLAVSFINHLATFAYSFVNMMQPLMTTLPVLNSRHGYGATARAGYRNMVELGTLVTYGTGWAETGRELAHAAKSAVTQGRTFTRADKAVDYGANAIKRWSQPGVLNSAAKIKAAKLLQARGYGTDAHLDVADVSEYGMNTAEKFINRSGRVARALPASVEAVNRYWTLGTTLDLALRDGMSEDAAIEHAVSMVEETQGGYQGENNPRLFQGAGAYAFQFKKYAVMFAQLYYGSMIGMFRGSSRRTKMQALKQHAGISGMIMLFAGFGGLPIIEMAKIGVMAAGFAGLGDGDWEDKEKGLQQFFQDMLSMALGDAGGKKAAEIFMHGLPRLFNTDLSGRMGGDSLFTFGAPKGDSDDQFRTWILNNFAGAPATMILDALKNMKLMATGKDASIEKIVPLPKMVADVIKAFNEYNAGKTTPAGKEITKPSSGVEALQKSLGFRTGTEAKRFELGGSGAKYKEHGKLLKDRTATMGQWLSADPNEREQIWNDVIQPWNEGKSKADRIDKGDLIRTLKRRKTDAKKQAKEDAAAEE